jgi:hypothetical protein
MELRDLKVILKEYQPYGLRVQASRTLKDVALTYSVEGVVRNCILTKLYESDDQFYALDIKLYNVKPVLLPLKYLCYNDAYKLGYTDADKLRKDILTGAVSIWHWKTLIAEMWDVYNLHAEDKIVDLTELIGN